MFLLRKSNIEELRQLIPLHKLPQVFQDAMYISLQLGIEYIWIDCLCIIQDSKEDWTCEAERMGDVYQYARCNIAAAGYDWDGSPGLFAERKAVSQLHPILSVDCVLDDKERAVPFRGLFFRGDRFGFRDAMDRSFLNSRAWVAQERALSPAIIHFTPELMWWECNELIGSEAFPMGISVESYDENRFKACTIRSLSPRSHPEDIYAFWRKFFGFYASCDLTHEQDRFQAALGIARTLSTLIDDNFIAGFWEGDLIRSLIKCRSSQIEDVPDTWRGPSWSWASLRADYDAEFQGSGAQPLNGVTVRVLSEVPGFKSDLDSTWLEKSDVRGLEITAPLRKLSADKRGGYHGEPPGRVSSRFQYDMEGEVSSAVDIPEEQAWRLLDPTHVLFLAKECYEGRTSPSTLALLVQQVLGVEDRSTFRRIGTARLTFDNEETIEEYLGPQQENGEYVPSPDFGERGLQEIILI